MEATLEPRVVPPATLARRRREESCSKSRWSWAKTALLPEPFR
jgi:hypothetical protein